MATKKGRINLADLGSDVEGERYTVDRSRPVDGQFRENVPLDHLAPNPRNPRDDLGSLEDLASIVEQQLQPATVVSRARWLELWPEDEADVGAARWVVVNGCRRLAASHLHGREGLDVVVRDSLASSKESIIWASISENLDRQNLDVIEEAKAVGQLVDELGSANAAAERMGRSATWISQRRTLLELHPDLQAELRAGDLAIRDARELARIPKASQVQAWAAQAAKRQEQGSGQEERNQSPRQKDPTPASAVRAIKRLHAEPAMLASALVEVLDDEQIDTILEALRSARRK